MPPVYELKVVAPEHAVYEGRARSLVAPGVEGYFGVLAHHAPMVAELGTGRLTIEDEDGRRRLFAVTGGIVTVSYGQVSILADAAESAEEIDVERAQAAEDRAKGRLGPGGKAMDAARAEAALQRALNRLRVAGEGRT